MKKQKKLEDLQRWNENRPEEDYVQISGLQRYSFCPRQWGLIHLERQWEENYFTVTGTILHEKVDDPFCKESRNSKVISRAMRLISHRLRVAGQADSVEFHPLPNSEESRGILLEGYPGSWIVRPVEYKRGRPKPDDRDRVQLCAQALCLEEMLSTSIEEGDLFYGETRRREAVSFDAKLREKVVDLIDEITTLDKKGETPPAIFGKRCHSCALELICLPYLKKGKVSVKNYIQRALEDDQER